MWTPLRRDAWASQEMEVRTTGHKKRGTRANPAACFSAIRTKTTSAASSAIRALSLWQASGKRAAPTRFGHAFLPASAWRVTQAGHPPL
jgi:hypothetical protein